MSDFALAAALALAFIVALGATGRLAFLDGEIVTPARRIAALGLLWAVLVLCVFYPTVSPGAAGDVDVDTLFFPSIFVGQLMLAVFLLLWWRLAEPVPLRRFLRLEHTSVDDVRMGINVGAVAWGLALTASLLVALAMVALGFTAGDEADPTGAPGQVPEIMLWLSDLPVAQKLIVVAVAMTVEEAFFRAFLQTRIGWAVSSVLFALSHGGYGMPTLTAAVFAVSLAIGWALRRRGNLLPCIVAHGVFDAVQLLVVMPLAVEHLRELA